MDRSYTKEWLNHSFIAALRSLDTNLHIFGKCDRFEIFGLRVSFISQYGFVVQEYYDVWTIDTGGSDSLSLLHSNDLFLLGI
jgi:hypothetical protein